MSCCPQVSGGQALLAEVQLQLQRLNAIKQEVSRLWRHRQVQVQQQQASCRRYQQRLVKVPTLERPLGGPQMRTVLVLCVPEPAGPEKCLPAVGLVHTGGPGFRPPDLQAAGTLQPGQTTFYRESRRCSTGTAVYTGTTGSSIDGLGMLGWGVGGTGMTLVWIWNSPSNSNGSASLQCSSATGR